MGALLDKDPEAFVDVAVNESLDAFFDWFAVSQAHKKPLAYIARHTIRFGNGTRP